MNTIKIDPRDFINPPYWKCPKCEKPNSFGVLSIYDKHYLRRCKECWYDSSYPLPELNKKVIYLDQFAISNMMKALNPKTKAHKKGTLDHFWVELFERLDSLCKLQLIVCPASGFHRRESLLSRFYGPLKRMYEQLSHGLRFRSHSDIKRFQITQHAKNWISGQPQEGPNLNVRSMVYGNIDGWQPRLFFSFNWADSLDWIDDLRKARRQIYAAWMSDFGRWQHQKNKSFDSYFKEVAPAFGKDTLKVYLAYHIKRKQIEQGIIPYTLDDLLPPSSVVLIHAIGELFQKAGIQSPHILPKVVEYLTSPAVANVPFIKISCMLYAALARKVAIGGRKKPPDYGMANDIEIISVLLPYCDAIFIDNECHSYLKEVPLRDVIDYGTKVFSLSNKEQFLQYLDVIEENAPKEQLGKVDEVYCKSWREPYKTLYIDQIQ